MGNPLIMQTLSLINNQWKKRVPLILTDAERTLLKAINNPENKAQKKALSESIESRSYVDASVEEAAQAQGIYDSNKIPDAQLIAVDIILPEGTGIINCRLNGEHKQIRF